MSRRAGFTLFEFLVALVITAVVAALANATLRAGIDIGERVDRSEAGVSAQVVVRALLLDALRHPPEEGGAAMNEPLFTLEERFDAAGIPSDALTFLSHGVGAAPGATGAWVIALESSTAGVRLRASPLDATQGAPFDLTLVAARGLDARVLARGAEEPWLERWDEPGRVPAAVAMAFLDASGRPMGPPLVARVALEEAP